MQLTRRVSAIIIVAAVLLGAGVCLLALNMPDPGPSSGTPFRLLAGTHSTSLINPNSFERYCLPPGEDKGKFLTLFWGMVANKTGLDDSSAQLLDLSITGYPGKLPQMMHFSFSSKKDWRSGSHLVVFSGDHESTCGCFSITPRRESPDISGKNVPSPGTLFNELEQISVSDLGIDGQELFITTATGYGPLTDTGDTSFLLSNESVIRLNNVTYDPQTSLFYPWVIQIMECTGEPGQEECGTSSTRPAILVFSDKRHDGITYRSAG